MSSLTTKKQNRVLYMTLIVLLISAALLVLFTGNAGNKETEETPEPVRQAQPIQNENDTTENAAEIKGKADSTEDAGLFGNRNQETKEAESETDPISDEAKAGTDAEAEQSLPTAAMGMLPSFISPVTDGYILREHSVTVPVFSPTMEDYRTHTGIDIGCAPLSSVLAAADGKIGNFWHDPMMGYSLSVIHDGGAVTIYQGIAEELPAEIEAGVPVKAGQTIACSGNTALVECADGEHVHFALQIDGNYVDPAEYLALPTMATVYEN